MGGDLAPSLGAAKNFADQMTFFRKIVPFLFTKNLDFIKNLSLRPFFNQFVSHPITVLLKILGGRMHGPSPTSHFWGLPHSPPKSDPPCLGLYCLSLWTIKNMLRPYDYG